MLETVEVYQGIPGLWIAWDTANPTHEAKGSTEQQALENFARQRYAR